MGKRTFIIEESILPRILTATAGKFLDDRQWGIHMIFIRLDVQLVTHAFLAITLHKGI
jgi:hypothetical protein